MVASDLFSIPRTKIFSNAIWVIFFNKRFDQATNFFIVTLIGGFFQIFHEATSNYIMVAIKKILLPSTTPYEIAPHEVFSAQWAEQYHRNTFIGQLGLVKRERIEKISFLEAETLYYKACLIQFRSISQLRNISHLKWPEIMLSRPSIL